VFLARARGEARDRTVQFDTNFEIDVVIIVGTEGTENETGFLLGLGVPKSYQSVETVIFR
jgi:hypothetical protein